VHYLTSDSSDGIDLEVLAVDGSPIHVTRILNASGEVLDMSFVFTLAGDEIRVMPMRTYIDFESFLSLQLPSHAFSMKKASQLWNISATRRMKYLSQVGIVDGKDLNHEIPNLNEVEVDNSISQFRQTNITTLKVVEFNAERGSQWFLAAQLLRTLPGLYDADIILLNEMDIGMARSRNEHTTRLMAHSLGMNYAWGLEFVELTNGNAEEQDKTANQPNLCGLHGNAILSKYPITDPVLLRDALHRDYFTNSASGTNANGYEKRLGGRMALAVKLTPANGTSIAACSIHKVSDPKNVAMLRKIALNGPAIFAGDQQSKFCAQFGLQESGNSAHKTTRATCDPVGKFLGHHGDIICSNIGENRKGVTHLPCVSVYDKLIKVSDHGFTAVQLGEGANRMISSSSSIKFHHVTQRIKSARKAPKKSG
jgi:endonuclease/exonuclease/phosphatase family metal-dependent hydrolase